MPENTTPLKPIPPALEYRTVLCKWAPMSAEEYMGPDSELNKLAKDGWRISNIASASGETIQDGAAILMCIFLERENITGDAINASLRLAAAKFAKDVDVTEYIDEETVIDEVQRRFGLVIEADEDDEDDTEEGVVDGDEYYDTDEDEYEDED